MAVKGTRSRLSTEVLSLPQLMACQRNEYG